MQCRKNVLRKYIYSILSNTISLQQRLMKLGRSRANWFVKAVSEYIRGLGFSDLMRIQIRSDCTPVLSCRPPFCLADRGKGRNLINV